MSPAAPIPPVVLPGLFEELGEAERLALSYAPRAVRAPLVATFAFDAALQRAALAKSEPVLAQVRLAWWRDACTRLHAAATHPALLALGENWTGSTKPLLDLVDAWEEFAVSEASFVNAAEKVAEARAIMLAQAVQRSADQKAQAATRCWTFHGLAARISEPSNRETMLERACAEPGETLPRSLRPLAVLAGLARRSACRGGGPLLGDRLSPLAAMRLGILGH